MVIETAAQGTSIQFCTYGQHSRMQTKLVAVRLGHQHALDMGPFSYATFMADLLPAFRDVGRRQRDSSLAVETRSLLASLSTSDSEVGLCWAPNHDLAAIAGTGATSRASPQDMETLPLCPTILRTIIQCIYCNNASVRWDLSDLRHDPHAIDPKVICTLHWTRSLTHREVALVVQFLRGHQATSMYLLRFGHEMDGRCSWCKAPIDDCHHQLL